MNMIFRSVLFACHFAFTFGGGGGPDIRVLDANTLQKLSARSDKMLVVMYSGSCLETKAFQPWLYALANLMPSLPVGIVDVARDGGMVAKSFNVSNPPVIKLFQRKAAPGKRLINFMGPMQFDGLFEWCKVVAAGDEHPLSEYGQEPAEHPEGHPGRPKSGSVMNKLPDGVRKMAETMVKENRLRNVLKERSEGKFEQYEALVSQEFRRIMSEDNVNADDKFGIQEVNRKARDIVREMILKTAPEHIRAEIEREVNMGDVAEQDSSMKS